MNKEIFSGRKIMPYKDYRAEAPSYLAKLPEPLRNFLGITIEKEKGKEIARMNPYLEYLFRQIPPLATLGRTTLARDLSSEYTQKMQIYRLLSFLTGLGLTPYNPEEAAKKAGATKKNRIEEYLNR